MANRAKKAAAGKPPAPPVKKENQANREKTPETKPGPAIVAAPGHDLTGGKMLVSSCSFLVSIEKAVEGEPAPAQYKVLAMAKENDLVSVLVSVGGVATWARLDDCTIIG